MMPLPPIDRVLLVPWEHTRLQMAAPLAIIVPRTSILDHLDKAHVMNVQNQHSQVRQVQPLN